VFDVEVDGKREADRLVESRGRHALGGGNARGRAPQHRLDD
jgi:hypothetical protein